MSPCGPWRPPRPKPPIVGVGANDRQRSDVSLNASVAASAQRTSIEAGCKSTIGENGPWVRAEVPGANGSAVPARNAVPAATIHQCMAAWSFTPTCRIARKIASLADAGVRALLRNRAVSRIRNNAERSAEKHGQALASQTFPTADQRSSRSHHPLPIPLRPR